MGWKNWLSGGLIGFVIGMVVLILTFFLPFPIVFHPVSWIMRECKEAGCILLLLTTPIFYIIIGAFIGWLIGKIKSK